MAYTGDRTVSFEIGSHQQLTVHVGYHHNASGHDFH